MSNDQSAMNELHWLIDMVQTIEVGLVVLDRDYNIQLWNGFMENHSGVSPNSIKGKNLFEQFPDLQADWLKKKMESVFVLKIALLLVGNNVHTYSSLKTIGQ